MGILRYVVQGFGRGIGRKAAREAIAGVEDATTREPVEEPPGDLAKTERAQKKEQKRRAARIEAELKALKRKAKQR